MIEFGFDDRLMEGLDSMGFVTPTPVQVQAIPIIQQDKDVIVCAQTGTGKTAAFLLPIINKIITGTSQEKIKALVIVPTRELAIQIDQQMEGFSYFTSVSSIAVYGGGDGSSFSREQQALKKGVEIVICTPGRMITHLNMNYINFSELKYLVLDEADRMLDIGFYDDIVKIISYLPEKRQNLMFSATMPQKIKELAKKVMISPLEVSIAISRPPEKIKQEAYVVYEDQKIPLVKYILKGKDLKSALVFCSTKSSTKQLARELKRAGILTEDIHSDLDQQTREEVLLMFKNHKLKVLVATDILSRGIDIDNIDLVVNFDIPNDAEDYVHRIGRTARASSEGTAITLIAGKDQAKFSRIEEFLGKEVTKLVVPAQFGQSPEYTPLKSENRGQKGGFGKKMGNKNSFNSRNKNKPAR